MKTLKITFLLLAVVLLTVSGQSSDALVSSASADMHQVEGSNYDLLAATKGRRILIPQG